MSKIALSYKIPYVDAVTMPASWARWLSQQGSRPNQALHAAAEKDGLITWTHAEHGQAPWMQFFYDWRFADLTGNGKIDMILTGGARRQIAYNQDGEELWRYEDDGAGFVDIRLDSNFSIYDIDDDGVPEMICARMIDDELHLCVVNARTGDLLRAIPFPDLQNRPRDCRGSIVLADISGRGHPADIIASWDYASLAVFDADLRLLWRRDLEHEDGREHVTMGHTPFVADIDGDGRDEILAGSCLLDHDGSTLWVASDLPALVTDGHADSVQIVALDEEGPQRIVMSTGGYCFSLEGELLWGRDDLKHGQALRVGKLRDDLPGNQVIVYEAASRVVEGLPDRVLALDNDGHLLWDIEVNGPDMQEGGFGFWLGDWNGDGLMEVFVNHSDGQQANKVLILDGNGQLLETLPGYLVYVLDIIGDSRAEAVTLSGIEPGMRLNIVTNDAPNPHAKTNQIVDRRETSKDMYNCTRY